MFFFQKYILIKVIFFLLVIVITSTSYLYSQRGVDSLQDAATRKIDDSPLVPPVPKNVEVTYELTDDGTGYTVYERVGGRDIRPPSFITREEFEKKIEKEQNRNFFKDKSLSNTKGSSAGNGLIPQLKVDNKLFQSIFGSNKVDIRPNVSITLNLAVRRNSNENPTTPQNLRSNTALVFNQDINMDVSGSVGERFKLRLNYDTKAAFAFENQFKINYEGKEDDIIKKVEAGNVSLPINGSLITGGQNLFGIKLTTQFGPVTLTTVASQQKGKTQEISVSAGSQTGKVDKKAGEYDDNRHFFLNHFFRSQFERSLRNLPIVTSQIVVNRIEVWATNRQGQQVVNNRNCVGLIDLGENNINDPAQGDYNRIYNKSLVRTGTGQYPENAANNLMSDIVGMPAADNIASVNDALTNYGLRSGFDYELVNSMRKLNENTDYILNPALGFISLSQRLNNNDALFVAYEYTVVGSPKVYRVGQFTVDKQSNDQNTNILFLKMLKPASIKTGPTPNSPEADVYPTWDLMMKNIYSLGSGQLSQDGFNIEILYESIDGSGDIVYYTDGSLKNKPLIQILGVDNLTNNSETGPDNKYDFINGATVIADKGLIMFPSIEPFGNYLVNKFKLANPSGYKRDSALYAFPQLYKYTQADANNYFQRFNRYKFRSQFQGKSNPEIYLNSVQVAPGSVKVTAGGSQLTEGTDYNVDYNAGKVTILNQSYLAPGQDIKVSFESNQFFGIDNKTMVGARADIKAVRNLNLGATVLHLNERPLNPKVIIGEEPLSNTIWGADISFKKESRLISNILDKLPFYSTSVPSEISFNGEFAQFIPNIPTPPGGVSEKGVAYIDDFDNARNTIDLLGFQQWKLASLPAHNREINNPLLAYQDTSIEKLNKRYKGFNRAKLSWYTIDNILYTQFNNYGFTEKDTNLNNVYTRQMDPREIFPNKQFQQGTVVQLNTLDLHYEPSVRGMYNYQYDDSKFNPDGTFQNPSENWAGIMRRTSSNTDFEALNVEFIELWVLDPFLPDNKINNHTGADLYINLGKVSEDILPDGVRAFENGLPKTGQEDANDVNLSSTQWGRMPISQPPTVVFDNTQGARAIQDVGLDGVGTSNNKERDFFKPYLDKINSSAVLNQDAKNIIDSDPSQDNFAHYFDGEKGTSLIDRYRKINGTEGNSEDNTQNTGVSRMMNPNPDVEDINADASLNLTESYYEYKISLRKQDLVIGKNNIVDIRETNVKLPKDAGSEKTGKTRWIQFRIPVRTGRAYGGIQDFKAIDFARMYIANSKQPIIVRIGKMDLVSTPWRRLIQQQEDGVGFPPVGGASASGFELGIVNYEENASRGANGSNGTFNYELPPNLQRVKLPATTTQSLAQNEGALVMRVKSLEPGKEEGAFRQVNYDMRNYGKVKLWLHAERPQGAQCSGDPEGEVFVRIGSDLTDNYYEYAIVPQKSDTKIANFWSDRNNIWKNQIEVDLRELQNVKSNRNKARYPFLQVYRDPTRPNYLIKGNPRLDAVKNIMVGIRNPKNPNVKEENLCLEIWINELRVSDFDLETSWAANARLNLKLADLANVSLTGAIMTPRFGSIEKRINERGQDTKTGFDALANIQGGKLFPAKMRLELPINLTYSRKEVRPRYDPLDPDIRLENAIENKQLATEKDYKLASSRDLQISYSYSFTNVRIVRKTDSKKKPKPWDIENFALSYQYNARDNVTPQVEYNRVRNFIGGIGYGFQWQPKNFKPFSKIKSSWLGLISNINFTPLPRMVTVKLEGNRHYEEMWNRSVTQLNVRLPGIYNKDFTIRRTYNMQWDLTQSLRFTYDANNLSRVDEPIADSTIDSRGNSLENNMLFIGKNDSRRKFNRINMGRTLTFQQKFTGSYQLPIRYIKPLDWITSAITYNADFGWNTAQLQNFALGNELKNSSSTNLTLQLNTGQFYRKFPFIVKLLKPIPKKTIVSLADSTRKEGDDTEVFFKRAGKMIAGWIFSIQTIDFNLSKNSGTQLYGYMPRTDNFGLDFGFKDATENRGSGATNTTGPAPGFDFIFGAQPDLTRGDQNSWIYQASEKGWFARNNGNTRPFGTTNGTQFRFRTSLMLFKDFKVDVTAEYTDNRTLSGTFVWDEQNKQFNYDLRSEAGSASMSFFSIGSIFDGENSATFKEFKENRKTISRRLYEGDPNYTNKLIEMGENTGMVSYDVGKNAAGYYNGYLNTSQQVLSAAFLSAYGPYSKDKIKMNEYNVVPQTKLLGRNVTIPMPNWNVNYTGLSQLDGIKDIFKTITIRQSYKSTYQANFLRNLNTDTLIKKSTGTIGGVDSVGIVEFVPSFSTQTISINENIVFGASFAFKNGITADFDYSITRNTTLNLGAMEVVENKTNTVNFRVSWRRDKLLSPITIGNRTIDLKNSVTYRLNITFRDNIVQNRYIDRTASSLITSGARVFSIKPEVDYQINSQLTATAYFEYNRNVPKISTSFPTTFSEFGLRVTFNLQP